MSQMIAQTISVTEARDTFPALVRQVVDRETAVIVTSRNQPRIVLVPWDTYQFHQNLQKEGAEYRLQNLVTDFERTAGALLEGYRPDSFDLSQGSKELMMLARQAWTTARLLDTPRRHLASIITQAIANAVEEGRRLTENQLSQLLTLFPLLRQTNLTKDAVANADHALLDVDLDALHPIGEELVAYYETTAEDSM